MKKIISKCIVVIMIALLLVPEMAQGATVKISKTKAVIEVDATLKLKITGTASKVNWSTSKKSIATVNTSGTVTAKAEGTATITAKAGSKKYTCKVSVVNSNKELPKNAFNEKNAIKNIKADLYSRGKGVIAVLENNYSYPISLIATVVYYDSNGHMIGASKSENYYFEKGKKCSMFFDGPQDGAYNSVKYDSYKISYSADKVNGKSNLLDISTKSNIGPDKVLVEVANNGEQRADFTQISVIFYKDGEMTGYSYAYVDVGKPDSTDYIEFLFPQDNDYNVVRIDDYKIYVNYSFYYTK